MREGYGVTQTGRQLILVKWSSVEISKEGMAMPIANYSVLAGRPTAGKVVRGASAHYQITMQAVGGPFTVAVNIQSVDGSEVLYAIEEGVTPPDLAGLMALPMGMTLLPQLGAKAKSGGAQAQMIQRAKAKALENAVVTLLNMTIADKDGVIYAFGSAFSDKGKVDGIHDIHMNQGNPKNNHGGDNGVWQDGALLTHLPSKGTWTAVFIAFQTESWTTDSAGKPV